jgi:methylenetetrahydrofolate dehydrogenase (NADP+)/methenyltetrahydrofolate cyclohydrolase
MPAQILKAAAATARLKASLLEQIRALKSRGMLPRMGVVFAGSHLASAAYSRAKIRTANELGVSLTLRELSPDSTQQAIVSETEDMCRDPDIHGVLVEMPLPRHVSVDAVLAALTPEKDVDGAHLQNRGRLLRGGSEDAIFPVTPLACLALLEEAGVSPAGRKITVIGRGETVGLPLAVMLIIRHATVTVCHTRSTDLLGAVKAADIVITAAGSPGLIKPSMLREGQTIVDVGITALPGGRIAGDVDPKAAEMDIKLSPVPGGVGQLTAVMVFSNLLRAIRLQEMRAINIPAF